MSRDDKLLECQEKWVVQIQQTEQAQQGLIDVMLKLRKELAEMHQLKKDYPQSEEIPARIQQNNKLLDECLASLALIKPKLEEFKKQKEALDEFIHQNGIENPANGR